MDLSYKRTCLSILILFGLIISGCGGKPQGEVRVESYETAPQVTITLHSQLELDYNLEPSPQLQVAEGDKSGKAADTRIDKIYSEMKKKIRKGSQSASLPEFKADINYQAIPRYEIIDPQRYAITIKKSPEISRIRKTVKLQDKPLIFAGRGYNISAFEKETKPAIDVDYSTHLVVTPPEPLAKKTIDQLDMTAGYSRDTKNLVYNATRSARFGKLLPSLLENKIDPVIGDKPKPLPGAESPPPLERNPDSVLLLSRGEKSPLVLRKAEKQFDLLAGNESLNKKQFVASSIKDLETSNKTPSIPQQTDR